MRELGRKSKTVCERVRGSDELRVTGASSIKSCNVSVGRGRSRKYCLCLIFFFKVSVHQRALWSTDWESGSFLIAGSSVDLALEGFASRWSCVCVQQPLWDSRVLFFGWRRLLFPRSSAVC